MIIVKLTGGLGNQMFQYAFAKQLAFRNNAQLKLDGSFFKTQTLRNYELDIFQIAETCLSEKELNTYLQTNAQSILQRIRNKINARRFHFKHIREEQFHVDPSLLHLKGNIYLDGYWQSENYFKEIEPTIKACFQLKPQIREQYATQAKQVQSRNAISIHIRRGDYVEHAATNKEHGTLPLSYYERALLQMLKHVENPFFYVFSDDMDWVKAHLKLQYPHQFVENNLGRACEDLYLMSLCKHQIIANSSFSWWAAWLNTNKEKIVIAPEKWFNESTKDTRDIIPNNWLKL
jgi:hypothetical protein